MFFSYAAIAQLLLHLMVQDSVHDSFDLT